MLLALVNYICPAYKEIIHETYPLCVFTRIRDRMQHIAQGVQPSTFLVIRLNDDPGAIGSVWPPNFSNTLAIDGSRSSGIAIMPRTASAV
jgi:hypothetical protein